MNMLFKGQKTSLKLCKQVCGQIESSVDKTYIISLFAKWTDRSISTKCLHSKIFLQFLFLGISSISVFPPREKCKFPIHLEFSISTSCK